MNRFCLLANALASALAGLLAGLLSLPVHAMSIDEAYASIPHQRTPFSADASRLGKSQAESLSRFFQACDDATVVRVRGLAALRAGDSAGLRRVVADYPRVIAALRQAPATAETRPAQALVIQAVQLHQAFFEARLAAGGRDATFTPAVHQASGQLHQAYALLMAAFTQEPAHNRQAFFDHLCALDFL